MVGSFLELIPQVENVCLVVMDKSFWLQYTLFHSKLQLTHGFTKKIIPQTYLQTGDQSEIPTISRIVSGWVCFCRNANDRWQIYKKVNGRATYKWHFRMATNGPHIGDRQSIDNPYLGRLNTTTLTFGAWEFDYLCMQARKTVQTIFMLQHTFAIKFSVDR